MNNLSIFLLADIDIDIDIELMLNIQPSLLFLTKNNNQIISKLHKISRNIV
jgi:hypothetical protein